MKVAKSKTTRKPVAVLISDVHYNINTLELADAAVKAALQEAKTLGVSLIVAGDLHDTKAHMRGEVVSRMISTFKDSNVKVAVLAGNHDLINEKGADHSLEFLRPYVRVIDHVEKNFLDQYYPVHLIPYQTSIDALQSILATTPEGSTLIMHQGVQGAFMGHYVQDKTSINSFDFANYRVISGHYHRAQDIKCGRPRKGAIGLFSYLGSPYTMNFGEALDGPKGYAVLYDDGSLERIPLPLRRHIVIDETVDSLPARLKQEEVEKDDLVWVKVRGPKSKLSKITKKSLADALGVQFKLDLIPIDSTKVEEQEAKKLTGEELFDKIIDNSGETADQKAYLKNLWREIM